MSIITDEWNIFWREEREEYLFTEIFSMKICSYDTSRQYE